MTLREIIARAVDDALARHNGNKTHAARELGIGLRTLRNWLTKRTTPYSHVGCRHKRRPESDEAH